MLTPDLTATEFARLIGITTRAAQRAFVRFRRGFAFSPMRLGGNPTKHWLPTYQVRGKQGAELAWTIKRADVPRAWIVDPKAS